MTDDTATPAQPLCGRSPGFVVAVPVLPVKKAWRVGACVGWMLQQIVGSNKEKQRETMSLVDVVYELVQVCPWRGLPVHRYSRSRFVTSLTLLCLCAFPCLWVAVYGCADLYAQTNDGNVTQNNTDWAWTRIRPPVVV